MSYAVARRTKEIGVRMALGARSSNVAWMISRDVAVTIALGSLVGVAGALVLRRFVTSLVFGLEPHDLATLLVAALVLFLVGLLAGSPRAPTARIDALIAVRYD